MPQLSTQQAFCKPIETKQAALPVLAANAAINIGRNRVSALSIIERTNSPVSSSICLI